MMKYILGGVLALVLLVGWLAPIGPLPGFFIGGTATAAPSEWPDTSDLHEIRLEVGEGIPRVVIIWVAEYEDELYVAGAADAGWTQILGEGGSAKLRIRDETYSVEAVRIKSGTEALVQAWVDKYAADYPDIVASIPSASEAANTMAVFRLDAGA